MPDFKVDLKLGRAGSLVSTEFAWMQFYAIFVNGLQMSVERQLSEHFRAVLADGSFVDLLTRDSSVVFMHVPTVFETT